jgi:hypothetical protein
MYITPYVLNTAMNMQEGLPHRDVVPVYSYLSGWPTPLQADLLSIPSEALPSIVLKLQAYRLDSIASKMITTVVEMQCVQSAQHSRNSVQRLVALLLESALLRAAPYKTLIISAHCYQPSLNLPPLCIHVALSTYVCTVWRTESSMAVGS